MSFELFLAEGVCDSEEVGRVDPYDPEQILRSIHTSNVEVKVAKQTFILVYNCFPKSWYRVCQVFKYV